MITIQGVKNTEDWKALREHWDGSKQEDGRIGSLAVIEAVDRGNWVTINKIACGNGRRQHADGSS